MAASAASPSPAVDGLDDGAVLAQRLGCPARHQGQPELVVGGAVAQVGDEVVGHPVAGDAWQRSCSGRLSFE